MGWSDMYLHDRTKCTCRAQYDESRCTQNQRNVLGELQIGAITIPLSAGHKQILIKYTEDLIKNRNQTKCIAKYG